MDYLDLLRMVIINHTIPHSQKRGPMNRESLAVTLVSGLDGGERTTVACELTGSKPRGAVHTAQQNHSGEQHAELALHLADHLTSLAENGQRGDVVVELHAGCDPIEIALVLEHIFATTPGPHMSFRNLVTVANAADIRRLLFCDTSIEAALASGHTDTADSSEELAVQLEFATTIVLTNLSHFSAHVVNEIHGLVRKLNPSAHVVPLALAMRTHRRLAPSATLAADLGSRLGWARELSGKAGLPSTINTIGSYIFTDPRPFHPGRLATVIDSCLAPEDVGLIVRSRGLVRLATRPDHVASWSSAGVMLALNPTGMESWDASSPVGQEIVFFGQNLNHSRLDSSLRASLVADDEFIAGPMEWSSYSDPFPVWHHEHGH